MNSLAGNKKVSENKLAPLVPSESASGILNAAYARVREHPSLRLGQSLYNITDEKYPEVTRRFVGGEHDFFFQPNAADAIETFLLYYVEK